MAERGDMLAERYRLDGRVRRDVAGDLWRATDLRLNRRVAVRFLAGPPGGGAFRRSVKLGLGMRHPNIAATCDAGTHGDEAYLVAESPAGRHLAKVIAQNPDGLPPERACAIGAQVADALHAVHQMGICHGALTPADVILLDGARDDAVKVMGFGGGAGGVSDEAGRVGLAFLAPERLAADGEITEQTDLYALGALMYALLTGVPPFSGSSTAALRRAVLVSPPPLARSRRPDVPQELSTLVKALMCKPQDKRPGPASAIADQLRAFVSVLSPDQRGSTLVPDAVLAPAQPRSRRLSLHRDRRSPGASPQVLGLAGNAAILDRLQPSAVQGQGQRARPARRGSRLRQPLDVLTRSSRRRRGLFLGLAAAAVVVLVVDPGGFVDKGRFGRTLPCAVFDPPPLHQSRLPPDVREGPDCSWGPAPGLGLGLGNLYLSQRRYGRFLVLGASGRARTAFANDYGVPSTTPGFESIREQLVSVADMTVSFRVSNLIITISWTPDSAGPGSGDRNRVSVADTRARILGYVREVERRLEDPKPA